MHLRNRLLCTIPFADGELLRAEAFFRKSFSDLQHGSCPLRTLEKHWVSCPTTRFLGRTNPTIRSALEDSDISCLMVRIQKTWAIKLNFSTIYKYSTPSYAFWLSSLLSLHFVFCLFFVTMMVKWGNGLQFHQPSTFLNFLNSSMVCSHICANMGKQCLLYKVQIITKVMSTM